MTTLVDSGNTCSCPANADSVTWTNLSGNSIILPPNNTPVLVATVPFGTGSIPLTTGMWGLVWLSWKAKSATAGKFSIADRRFIGGVQGASVPASYTYYPGQSLDATVAFSPGSSGSSVGLSFDGPDALIYYVQLISSVNTSGDLEISLNCVTTDSHGQPGVAWDFSDLSAEFKIIGNQ
jgi:hypothetical protein